MGAGLGWLEQGKPAGAWRGKQLAAPSLLSRPLALAAAHQVPGEDGGVLRVAQAVDGVDPARREAELRSVD